MDNLRISVAAEKKEKPTLIIEIYRAAEPYELQNRPPMLPLLYYCFSQSSYLQFSGLHRAAPEINIIFLLQKAAADI